MPSMPLPTMNKYKSNMSKVSNSTRRISTDGGKSPTMSQRWNQRRASRTSGRKSQASKKFKSLTITAKQVSQESPEHHSETNLPVPGNTDQVKRMSAIKSRLQNKMKEI